MGVGKDEDPFEGEAEEVTIVVVTVFVRAFVEVTAGNG